MNLYLNIPKASMKKSTILTKLVKYYKEVAMKISIYFLMLFLLILGMGCTKCPECPDLTRVEAVYECVGVSQAAAILLQGQFYDRDYIVTFCECEYDESKKWESEKKKFTSPNEEKKLERRRKFCENQANKVIEEK